MNRLIVGGMVDGWRVFVVVAAVWLMMAWANPKDVTPDAMKKLESGEILLEIRFQSDADAGEGEAIAVIDAPADRLFRVITDRVHFAEFMPYVKKSEVEVASDGGIVNYQYLALPLIKNRFYKVRVAAETRQTDLGEEYRTYWQYIPGSGNIRDTHGEWNLLPWSTHDRTFVRYLIYTDPGGKLPQWVQRVATKKALKAVLEAVRKRVKDPRYNPE